jgi:hypothetical protein
VVIEGLDDVGGPSPVVITLDPGFYRVVASLSNHQSADATVSLRAGAHQVVTLALASQQPPAVEPEQAPRPSSEEPTTPVERQRWTGGPWVVFGVGAGIALTGVALWAAAYAGSQREDRFDSVEDYDHWQYRVYDLAFAGDILVGVGAAAAVAGLIWLTIDRIRARRQQPSSRRVLMGSLTPISNGYIATIRLER